MRPRAEWIRSRLMDVTTLSAAVSTRRLLVVEDDDSIRETVGEALRAEGFEVQTCADGASALNLITAETSDPVDLIVLDLMLPGLGGLDLCRCLLYTSPSPRDS